MSTREKVYEFIKESIVENGYSPTYNDIATRLDISKSTAFDCISKLEEEGLIELERGKSRTMKIVDWTR